MNLLNAKFPKFLFYHTFDNKIQVKFFIFVYNN